MTYLESIQRPQKVILSQLSFISFMSVSSVALFRQSMVYLSPSYPTLMFCLILISLFVSLTFTFTFVHTMRFTEFLILVNDVLPYCRVFRSAEIKKAYHIKARQNHPDRNLSDSQVSEVSARFIHKLSGLFSFSFYCSVRVVQML